MDLNQKTIYKEVFLMDKNIPMEIKTVKAKWFSVGYTPSFDYCPSCDKQIGWKDIEDKMCHHCTQKFK
jgi:hypothetical protein